MFSIKHATPRSLRVAAKLAGFALMVFVATPAQAQTPVEFGDTITDPGVYFLHGNQSGAGSGITIDSSDVTLLLLRFTLRGDGNGTGIRSNGHDNIVIYGGRVTNFEVGIDLIDGEYCTVKDVRIDHCLYNGLKLRFVRESWALRLRTDHNGEEGVDAIGCSKSRFISILSHDNGHDGILLRDVPGGVAAGRTSRENKVKLCWAAYNERDGIRVVDSDLNEITRNQCVNNADAGIRLDTNVDQVSGIAQALDGADDNELRSNWCVFNDDGIVAEWSSSGNTMTNNTALANFDRDMLENNASPPCENTWFLNFFLTKDGDGEDCIF